MSSQSELPGDIYVSQDQEAFAYQYPQSQAQSQAQINPSYVVVDPNGRFSSFESQIPGSQFQAASSTGFAGASYGVAFATSTATMPQKRTSEDRCNEGQPVKQIRTERPEDFSKAVLKKLKDSNRTGQACDRCKVRKIRCDDNETGCGPCQQNSNVCVTTDRISGNATKRGYTELLQRQVSESKNQINELQRQILQMGGRIDSPNEYQTGGGDHQQHAAPPTWNATNSYPPQTHLDGSSKQETSHLRPPPTVVTEIHGSKFLGVSAGNPILSSIKGTALSILGMEIDTADFNTWDMDEPKGAPFEGGLFNKSYQSFLQTALNINPKMPKVELPERAHGLEYADWYFNVLNPYSPLLHKAVFVELLTRIYDEPDFQPTAAEQVMVHMVFAIMLFQFAVRNNDDPAQKDEYNLKSNEHYHYSLSLFYQLSSSHTFQDVQALTLICLHLRNFPKPGASWILCQTTMSLAIELGLHLSAKRWVGERKPSFRETELRKRTFWVLLTVHVTVSGKLSRPLMLKYEDFDVELPDFMDDMLLNENGLDTSRQGICTHEIGLVAMRLIPLFIELYTTIYAVRRYPENYITTVKSLEGKVQTWKDNLPAHLRLDAFDIAPGSHHFALYAEMWYLEFRLLLRHPSVEMTDDNAFRAESMRACEEFSRQMLSCVVELQELNALDTTWYNSAVYLMAITTTLFAQHDKKATKPSEMANLRVDMDKWLNVMGEVGRLLGSGNRLKEAVRGVIDGTLSILETRVTSPKNVYLQNSKPLEDSKVHLQRSDSGNPYGNLPSYPLEQPASSNGLPSAGYSQGQIPHHTASYTPATVYSTYAEVPSTIAYTPHDNSHAYNNYSAGRGEADALAYPLSASQAQQNSQWHGQITINPPGAQDWQQWASSIVPVEHQDRYSANALMSLGGRDAASNGAQSALGVMGSMQLIGYEQQMGNLNNEIMNWPRSLTPNDPSSMDQTSGMSPGQGLGPGSG